MLINLVIERLNSRRALLNPSPESTSGTINEKAGRMLYDRGGFRGRYSPHSMGAIDVLVVTETRTDGVHLEGALGKVCTTYSLSEVTCHVHGSRLTL